MAREKPFRDESGKFAKDLSNQSRLVKEIADQEAAAERAAIQAPPVEIKPLEGPEPPDIFGTKPAPTPTKPTPAAVSPLGAMDVTDPQQKNQEPKD